MALNSNTLLKVEKIVQKNAGLLEKDLFTQMKEETIGLRPKDEAYRPHAALDFHATNQYLLDTMASFRSMQVATQGLSGEPREMADILFAKGTVALEELHRQDNLLQAYNLYLGSPELESDKSLTAEEKERLTQYLSLKVISPMGEEKAELTKNVEAMQVGMALLLGNGKQPLSPEEAEKPENGNRKNVEDKVKLRLNTVFEGTGFSGSDLYKNWNSPQTNRVLEFTFQHTPEFNSGQFLSVKAEDMDPVMKEYGTQSFDVCFGSIFGKQQKKLLEEQGMDPFDMIKVTSYDGRLWSARDYFAKKHPDKSIEEQSDLLKCELMQEFMSGEKKLEFSTLQKRWDGSIQSGEPVSLKPDYEIREPAPSLWARILDFLGIKKIQHLQDKADTLFESESEEERLSRQDKDRERRQQEMDKLEPSKEKQLELKDELDRQKQKVDDLEGHFFGEKKQSSDMTSLTAGYMLSQGYTMDQVLGTSPEDLEAKANCGRFMGKLMSEGSPEEKGKVLAGIAEAVSASPIPQMDLDPGSENRNLFNTNQYAKVCLLSGIGSSWSQFMDPDLKRMVESALGESGGKGRVSLCMDMIATVMSSTAKNIEFNAGSDSLRNKNEDKTALADRYVMVDFYQKAGDKPSFEEVDTKKGEYYTKRSLIQNQLGQDIGKPMQRLSDMSFIKGERESSVGVDMDTLTVHRSLDVEAEKTEKRWISRLSDEAYANETAELRTSFAPEPEEAKQEPVSFGALTGNETEPLTVPSMGSNAKTMDLSK